MSKRVGRYVGITPLRHLVVDLLRHCQKVPCASVERVMDLAPLCAARQACIPRPSWTAIFLKAMGVVADRNPELRRSFMPFPWPHLYEHPSNVANCTIERQYKGERVVFFIQIRRPENKTVKQLDEVIRNCQEAPVESVKFFYRAIKLSKLPWFIRRIVWWVGLYLFGKLRSHNFGTFSLTSVAGAGAGVLNMSMLVTSTLHFGLFDDDKHLPMRLTFDHRVLDGNTMAQALVELEKVLLTDVLAEIDSLRALKAA